MHHNSFRYQCGSTGGSWSIRLGLRSQVSTFRHFFFKIFNELDLLQQQTHLERHSTSNRLNVKKELAVWCQGPLSLDHERSRAGIQSPIRIRSVRCWSDGSLVEAVEDCTTKVPLWSWNRFRIAVSFLNIWTVMIKKCSLFCRKIPTKGSVVLKIHTNACKGDSTEVKYLEHVQAVISLNSTRRGDVELFLTSPMGTR